MTGQTISHYRILSKLGEGGMGVVYEAEDTKLRRTVALKFLPPDSTEHRERFLREAQAAASLNHPNICTIYEIDDEHSFIAMERVEGQSLKEKIGARPLPLAEAIGIAMQACTGLQAAHEKGIVHRDIKPANLMLTGQGQVKIMDFGLAQVGDRTRITKTGTSLGTPAYMSPEQVRGEATDRRTDLWSLGVLLYEEISGQTPFRGDTAEAVSYNIVHADPEPLTALRTGLPLELDRIIAKALRKDPRDRYQNAEDLMVDLRHLAGRPVAATGTKRGWKVIVPAATLGGLALFAAGYFSFHRTTKLTDKDTIVLAEFKNTTGDPVFDETLRQGLAVQLGQSPFLSLVSEAGIRKTLGLMGRPADARLTPEVARDICVRTGSAAYLDGSIARLGSQYVLGLRASNCQTGDVLDERQVQAARKEDVLTSLSQIASEFRTKVGESLATIEKHDMPLADATTPSLEAWKAYSLGWKVLSSSGDHVAAVPHFKQATEIDPEFAMAHAALGLMYGALGESDISAQSTSTAYRLRERTSDREKFFITASYARRVTGNLEVAQQTCELWARTYPRDARPHEYLAATYPVFGKYEKGVEEGKKGIALDPGFFISYSFVAWHYQLLNRLEEAESAIQRAFDRKLDDPAFLIVRYDIAFLKGDQAGMERELALSRSKPEVEDVLAHRESLGLAYSGHLQQATRASRRVVAQAQHAAKPVRAALFETGAALREGFFGNAREARSSARKALDLSKDRDVEYGAAFALALAGDSTGSQTLATDLENRFREDTSVRFSYLPALGALLAVKRGESAKAIELLQSAVANEFGAPHSVYLGFFGALYPTYVRGVAYLAAHQGAEAATEFQKILDHRGVVVSDPIGALAHLQLGRALAMSGDKAKAKAAYQDFLNLWKDADSDIPILQQAKAEYAKL